MSESNATVTTAELQERWHAALMDNYGTPALALVTRQRRRGLGRRRPPLPGPRGGGRGERARPRAPRRRRGGHEPDRAARARLELLRPRAGPAARRAAAGAARTPPDVATCCFCNSGAEANEAAFKIARRTGRPHIVAARERLPRPHHGRARAHRTAAQARAVRAAAAPASRTCPYGDVAALDAAVDADTAAVVLEPILGEAGVIVPPEGYLRARGRSPRPAGRCSCSTRCRPASAAPARGSPTRPPGSGRTSSRWRRGSAAACRSERASASARPARCSNRASTAPPSAATRSAAPPRSPCSTRSPAEGLLEHVQQVGKEIATGIEALGHPLVTEVSGGRADDRCRARRRRSPPRCRRRPAKAGYLVNNAVADRIRLIPPLVLTEAQARRVPRRAARVPRRRRRLGRGGGLDARSDCATSCATTT